MTNAEAEFLMGVAMIAVAVTLTAGPLALLAMGVVWTLGVFVLGKFT